MSDQSETGCCPKFDPAKWDDKVFEWKEKKFVKDKVFTIFYMPVNFGKVITKLIGKIIKTKASMPDNLGLSDHTSKWNMDIYVAVDQNIPDAENMTISGKFYSRVYEGPFKDTGKWCKDYDMKAKDKGINVEKMYMWYTTCPKCAKVYGKNYVAIIGEISNEN